MNKIIWYLNRLSLMSPQEMAYRVKEKCFSRFARQANCEVFPAKLRARGSWLVDANKPQWQAHRAENLLAGKFSFFSFQDKVIGSNINWHQDYKSGKSAVLAYGKDIDYRNCEKIGDIKYSWELNRHQHLIELAKAFYITGDDKYRIEVERQIKSWLEQNPYLIGVNWCSSLELAIRLVSWSWVWSFLGENISRDLYDEWGFEIYGHCRFIANNFSRFSSANNHLIGEAAGLFIASVVWDFGRESVGWKDKSYLILVQEIEKQNYADGVNKEQAVSYQQFVLDFFLLAVLLGERNGVKFPKSYWKRIEKMLEYIASIMNVFGNVPNVGDSDDGFAVKFVDAADFCPYRSLLATGAVIFNRGDFKQRAGSFDEKSQWLLGEEGKNKFEALTTQTYDPVKSFPEGGYYILSTNDGLNDEIRAVFDCGPLGYLSLAAHGHADALSFTLSVGGDEFLIDPGTYAYHTLKEWRDYFRGTRAHNTIAVDGFDQSVIGGNFMWLKKANSRILKFEDSAKEAVVAGEHDGYARLKGAVTHEREIRLDKYTGKILIIDRINGKGSHEIEQNFHFNKNCSVEKIAPNRFEALKNGKRIILQIDEKLSPALFKGNLNPICGWQSRKFDVKDPCFTLVNKGKISGTSEFNTKISIWRN